MFSLMPRFTRRSPLVALQSDLFDGFDSMIEGFRTTSFAPKIDVKNTEKRITIQAELPGMTEEDIQISVINNVMTIKGEKKEEKEEKGDVWHKEISYGSFERSFSLPEGIDNDKIEASFKNGRMDIIIPKIPVVEPKKIAIKKQ